MPLVTGHGIRHDIADTHTYTPQVVHQQLSELVDQSEQAGLSERWDLKGQNVLGR